MAGLACDAHCHDADEVASTMLLLYNGVLGSFCAASRRTPSRVLEPRRGWCCGLLRCCDGARPVVEQEVLASA